MKCNKYIYFIICWLFFPILITEVFMQILNKNGLIYDVTNIGFKGIGLNKAQMHLPKQKNITAVKTLYPDYNKVKKLTLRTDKYGTIIPSSLEKILKKDSFVLFCGGSTTESYIVPEGQRMPDIYSKITGIKAVNTGKSGKDLSGCIKTIDYILKIEKYVPSKIVIATSSNNLMNFGRLEINNFVIDPPFKKISRNILPGIYISLKKIYKNLIKKNSSELLEYEIAIKDGCCHGAGQFNKGGNLPFNWESEYLKKEYYKYTYRNVDNLKKILAKRNFPKSKVVFFIEPYSFLKKRIASKFDNRQNLYDFSGIKLSNIESHNLLVEFDNIYTKAIKSHSFKVLNIKDSELKGDHFYDAGHYTPEGAKRIAEFHSRN